MPFATQRETPCDRRFRIELLISAGLAYSKLVRRHLLRPINDMALVIHRPVEGNDAVRLLHLVPGECARIGRKNRIGTGIVFGADVEADSLVENREIVAVETEHE